MDDFVTLFNEEFNYYSTVDFSENMYNDFHNFYLANLHTVFTNF